MRILRWGVATRLYGLDSRHDVARCATGCLDEVSRPSLSISVGLFICLLFSLFRTPNRSSSYFKMGETMNCPNCNVTLLITDRQGIEIDYCPQCRGVWLD